MSETTVPKTGQPWAIPLPGWQPTGEPVDRLTQDSVGAWMVWAQGCTHLWHVRPTAVYWTRLLVAGRSRSLGDPQRQRLTRVDRWPIFGGSHFLWFDDPHQPRTTEQWRQSSTIRHIERITQAERFER